MTNSNSTGHLKTTAKATGTFCFKQFKIEDGKSTMKVGTDAVLLGAVAEVKDTDRILEIGTGCGVISLMLAQRSNAQIDAVEIDEESVLQAKVNVLNSPWKDRINIIHSSLQDFARQTENKYSLIISNPPFFSRSLKSPFEKRNISRHNDNLSFEELINGAAQLMHPGAGFWLILPVNESRHLINAASEKGFYLHTFIRIFPREGKCHYRNVLHFKKILTSIPIEKDLLIRKSDNTYTDDYKTLTQDFYLDF
jgi:tRNA1Val (adenine37-N6)-methyltransferase